MSTEQNRALEMLNQMQDEWRHFCIRVLQEKNRPGVYLGEKRIVKMIGDAFIQQLERFVEDM